MKIENRISDVIKKLDLKKIKLLIKDEKASIGYEYDDFRLDIWRNSNKVIISILGWDDIGTWAVNVDYSLGKFHMVSNMELNRAIRKMIKTEKDYLEE